MNWLRSGYATCMGALLIACVAFRVMPAKDSDAVRQLERGQLGRVLAAAERAPDGVLRGLPLKWRP